jgi:hypothetical protein
VWARNGCADFESRRPRHSFQGLNFHFASMATRREVFSDEHLFATHGSFLTDSLGDEVHALSISLPFQNRLQLSREVNVRLYMRST